MDLSKGSKPILHQRAYSLIKSLTHLKFPLHFQHVVVHQGQNWDVIVGLLNTKVNNPTDTLDM